MSHTSYMGFVINTMSIRVYFVAASLGQEPVHIFIQLLEKVNFI